MNSLSVSMPRAYAKGLQLKKTVGARTAALWLLIAGPIVFFMLWRLGALTPGLSSYEMRSVTVSLHGIIHDPLFLPLKAVQYGVFHLSRTPGPGLLRLPGALFGLVSIGCLAGVLRTWYGRRPMIYGTLLFGLSSWTLHSSRLAGNSGLYLAALPALLILTHYLQKDDTSALKFCACAVGLGLILYVPGMVWLVLLVTAWRRRELLESFAGRDAYTKVAWCLLLAATLALLVFAFVRQPSLALTWLGKPAHLAPPLTVAKQFGAVFLHTFVRGPAGSNLWLGHLPAVGIFTSAAALIGADFYARHWQAPRSRLLLAAIIVSAILIALQGPVLLSLFVPIVYLLATAGIAYLLHNWLKIFPRNPLARRFGMTALALTVGLACWYNLRAYFVAWPHNPVTTNTFASQEQHRL